MTVSQSLGWHIQQQICPKKQTSASHSVSAWGFFCCCCLVFLQNYSVLCFWKCALILPSSPGRCVPALCFIYFWEEHTLTLNNRMPDINLKNVTKLKKQFHPKDCITLLEYMHISVFWDVVMIICHHLICHYSIKRLETWPSNTIHSLCHNPFLCCSSSNFPLFTPLLHSPCQPFPPHQPTLSTCALRCSSSVIKPVFNPLWFTDSLPDCS